MFDNWKRRLGAYVILSTIAVAACDDSSGIEKTLAIVAVPSALTIFQGEGASVTVGAARGGGFDGPVTLSVEGLPTGVTAAADTIPSGSTNATIDFAVTSSAAPGTSQVTIRATGVDVPSATTTLAFTVEGPPQGTLITQGPNGLVLIDTDGSNRRALASVAADDMAPQWNPSGTEAVFHDRFVSNRLYVVNMNGQVRPQNAGIPGITEQFWAEYSADGTWIYFQAWVDEAYTYRIWRIRPDGTGAQQVSPIIEFRTAEAPSPSPNGQEVAYTLRGAGNQVVIQNLATGLQRILGTGFGVRWSPDGSSLAFVSGDALVVQRADGTQRRVLNQGVPYRTGLDWSADSEWVVARQDNIDGGIDLVRIDGGRVVNIPNTQDLRQPSLHE